jgi:hypothetical protein
MIIHHTIQDEEHSYMHAMTKIGQSATQARMLMDKFTDQQQALFIDNLMLLNNREAFFNLGMGMHPLMDMFSPSHRGFQTWDPNDKLGAVNHILNESFSSEGLAESMRAINQYYQQAINYFYGQ